MRDVESDKTMTEQEHYLTVVSDYIKMSDRAAYYGGIETFKVGNRAVLKRYQAAPKYEQAALEWLLMARLENGDVVIPRLPSLCGSQRIAQWRNDRKALRIKYDSRWLYPKDIDWIKTIEANQGGMG